LSGSTALIEAHGRTGDGFPACWRTRIPLNPDFKLNFKSVGYALQKSQIARKSACFAPHIDEIEPKSVILFAKFDTFGLLLALLHGTFQLAISVKYSVTNVAYSGYMVLCEKHFSTLFRHFLHFSNV